jgi:hypothetical protein
VQGYEKPRLDPRRESKIPRAFSRLNGKFPDRHFANKYLDQADGRPLADTASDSAVDLLGALSTVMESAGKVDTKLMNGPMPDYMNPYTLARSGAMATLAADEKASAHNIADMESNSQYVRDWADEELGKKGMPGPAQAVKLATTIGEEASRFASPLGLLGAEGHLARGIAGASSKARRMAQTAARISEMPFDELAFKHPEIAGYVEQMATGAMSPASNWKRVGNNRYAKEGSLGVAKKTKLPSEAIGTKRPANPNKELPWESMDPASNVTERMDFQLPLREQYKLAKAKYAEKMREAMGLALQKSGASEKELARVDPYISAIFDPYGAPEASNALKGMDKTKRLAGVQAAGKRGLQETGGVHLPGQEDTPLVPLGINEGRAQFGMPYSLPASKGELYKRVRDIDWSLAPALMEKFIPGFAKSGHMKSWYNPKEVASDIGVSKGMLPHWGSDPERLLLKSEADVKLLGDQSKRAFASGPGSKNSEVMVEDARASALLNEVNRVVEEGGFEALKNIDPQIAKKHLEEIGARAKSAYIDSFGGQVDEVKGFGLEDASVDAITQGLAKGKMAPMANASGTDPHKLLSYVANHFGNKMSQTPDRHITDYALSMLSEFAKETKSAELLQLVKEAYAGPEQGRHAIADAMLKSMYDWMLANRKALPSEISEILSANEGLAGHQAVGWGSKNDLIDAGIMTAPSGRTERVKSGGEFIDKFVPEGTPLNRVETDTRLGSGSTFADINRHQVGQVFGVDPNSMDARRLAGLGYQGKLVTPPIYAESTKEALRKARKSAVNQLRLLGVTP